MKKVISVFTALVMTLTMTLGSMNAIEEIKYSDVPESYWAYKTIDEMTKKGIINGFDGKFLPDDSIKRSEIIKIIIESEKAGLLELEDKGITAEFSDVKTDDWFEKYVAKAVASGIIKGNDLNEFMPQQTMSRQDFATVIARIYLTQEEIDAYKSSKVLDSYKDKDVIADYATGPMAFCVEKGIINGMTENTLEPKLGATRAQACTIVMRASEKIPAASDETKDASNDTSNDTSSEATNDTTGEITNEDPDDGPDRSEVTMERNKEVIKEYNDGVITVNNDMYVGGKTDFAYADFVDTTMDSKGDVVLLPGKTTGYFTSPVIKTTHTYSQAMLSWNATATDTSYVNPEFAVVKDEAQSVWYPFGKWTTKNDRGSSTVNVADSFGKMYAYGENVDVFVAANAFRYQVKLTRATADEVSPSVSRVSVAFEMNSYVQPKPFTAGWTRELNMEPYKHSQLVEGGSVAGNICSPTSIAMLLGYQGVKKPLLDVAYGARDYNAEMFGMWVYNIAYAGGQGVKSYVRRCHGINDLKSYIAQGIPVACSITVKKAGDLTGFGPNGESSTTPGHLVVISGMEQRNGVTYVVCYDPFSSKMTNIKRLYRADQFDKCWGQDAVLPYVTYVLGE